MDLSNTTQTSLSDPTQPTSFKNQPPFVYFLIGTIIVILVAVVSFVAGRRVASPVTTNTPVSVTPSTTPNTFTPDPIAGWKTYLNARYQFSLQYPPDWHYIETPSQTFATGNDQVWFGPMVDGWPPPNTDARSAIVFSFTETDPSTNWKPEFFTDYSSEDYQLGSMTARKVSGTNKEGLFNETAIIARLNDSYLTIIFQKAPDELINQILSTFQFTN